MHSLHVSRQLLDPLWSSYINISFLTCVITNTVAVTVLAACIWNEYVSCTGYSNIVWLRWPLILSVCVKSVRVQYRHILVIAHRPWLSSSCWSHLYKRYMLCQCILYMVTPVPALALYILRNSYQGRLRTRTRCNMWELFPLIFCWLKTLEMSDTHCSRLCFEEAILVQTVEERGTLRWN